MRKNKKDIEDRIKRHELSKPNNKASLELFAKIQAIRDEEGDSTECIEVDVPDDIYRSGQNLFPYIKKARKA